MPNKVLIRLAKEFVVAPYVRQMKILDTKTCKKYITEFNWIIDRLSDCIYELDETNEYHKQWKATMNLLNKEIVV